MRITNDLNLPQPFVSAAESDYVYRPKRYSVTSLLDPVRKTILQRRHGDEITADASEMVWAIFGTAVHSILENAKEAPDQIKENSLAVEVDGYTLSGRFDLYDDATGTVTDYKTCAVWKVVNGEFEDWRRQTLCYAWMLRQIGFDCKRGQIVAVMKDHSKGKAKYGQHPPLPISVVEWSFTEADFLENEAWVRGRLGEIRRCEELPDDELPLCSKEERWNSDEKWAVMKKGRKSAVKLYASEGDAKARSVLEGAGFYVEYRPGTDTRCAGYCYACRFCGYWREHYGEES